MRQEDFRGLSRATFNAMRRRRPRSPSQEINTQELERTSATGSPLVCRSGSPALTELFLFLSAPFVCRNSVIDVFGGLAKCLRCLLVKAEA